MKDKIKFHIPGFYEFFDINAVLHDFMTNRFKEYFVDNIEIGSMYGSFPDAIWNGGRPIFGECDEQTITQYVEHYEKLGIPLRFTFTNSCLNKSHLDNKLCNMIMEIASNGKNGVIVNNEILEDYLRNKYPNYQYILSTTAGIRDIDKINELSDIYDCVVINYNDNHNKEFLTSLKNKDKIEILVNESCMANCPKRKDHYEFIARKQLGLEPSYMKFECASPGPTNFYAVMTDKCKRNHIITPGELYDEYANMGFSNFKLQGRGLPVMYAIESYLTYMVKPEFKDFVRYEFFSG